MTHRRLPPAPLGLALAPGSLVTVGEAPSPPETTGWMHEIKVDGWRVALLTDGRGGLRLQTRKGADRTWDFISPVRDIARCGHKLIIDGEIAVPDDTGRTKLDALHDAMRNGKPESLAYFAFDLLHLDGEDTTSWPIERRKGALATVLKQIQKQHPLPRVVMVDGIIDYGPSVFRRAGELGAEGIVSKRLGSPYEGSDRPSVTWLKSICSA